MKSSNSFAMCPASCRWSAPRIALTALVATGLLLLGSQARAQAPGNHPDADTDGLVHAQEKVIGSSPTQVDTDHDTYSDLEEIARQSSPRITANQPDLTKRLGVGLTAHAQTNGLHVLVCVFMSDMDLRTKQLQIGLLAHGQLVTLTNHYIATHAVMTYHPASVQGGCVVLIDLTLDPNLVHGAGHLTVWARAGLPGMTVSASADAVHLLSIAGIVVLAVPLDRAAESSSGTGPGTTGSIYVPLLPTPGGCGPSGNGSGSGTGGAPATWEPGQVCFQRSQPVGVDGATVTNEVVAAECIGGWDGFCPPNCSSSVGSTYRTVDPLVLIGG